MPYTSPHGFHSILRFHICSSWWVYVWASHKIWGRYSRSTVPVLRSGLPAQVPAESAWRPVYRLTHRTIRCVARSAGRCANLTIFCFLFIITLVYIWSLLDPFNDMYTYPIAISPICLFLGGMFAQTSSTFIKKFLLLILSVLVCERNSWCGFPQIYIYISYLGNRLLQVIQSLLCVIVWLVEAIKNLFPCIVLNLISLSYAFYCEFDLQYPLWYTTGN